MARGNRCYLCGEKLRKGVCTACGLDNARMTRRDYRLNETTPVSVKRQQVAARKAEQMKYANAYKADQRALEELGRPLKQTAATKKAINNKNASGKKWKGLKIAAAVYAVCAVIPAIGGCVESLVDELSYGIPEYVEVESESDWVDEPYNIEDEYLWVERELSETGEYYEAEFGNGMYQVGVHIPEGLYTVLHADGNSGSMYLQDSENSIYMNLGFGEDSYEGYMSMEDVRLYDGAHLEITGNIRLLLVSENAQTDALSVMENPMDSNTVVNLSMTDGEYLVGQDISAGVYDMSVGEGYSSVSLSYDNGTDSSYSYYWLDSETLQNEYKNVIFIEGMTVLIEYGDLTLTPSKWVMAP